MIMKKNSYFIRIVIVITTAVLFFAVTLPFRRLFQVVSVTEVRPAAALNPTCGLLFGFWGAFGCAVGNLAADLISGYSPLMCVLGFAVQMIYGLLPHFVWKVLKCEVRLNSSENILRYMVLSVVNSAITAVLLGVAMSVVGIGEVISTTVLMMFFNNFVFCVVLGIPMILIDTKFRLKKLDETFSLNERLILMILFLAILSAAIIGVFAFGEISGYTTDLLALWNRVYIYISIDLILFSAVIVVFLRYAERRITIPLERLSYITGEYSKTGTDKELNTKWIVEECRKYEDVHSEAGELARAFAGMAVNIERYIESITKMTAENERIGAELDLARQIQTDMLPRIFPPFPERTEFDIYASMNPAKEVGGDFYDFFLIDDDHLALVIADVSGKGVPAALFMVVAKTLLKNQVLMKNEPKDVLTVVNKQLCENNDAQMFVTVWLGVYEISTGILKAANAGHEYPAICKANGQFELFEDEHDFVLAGMENITYHQYEIQLSAGDTLFVYTDGVAEATNSENELFGMERMIDSLNKKPDADPEELTCNVSEGITAFVGKADQFDDITMLAVRINDIKGKKDAIYHKSNQ